MKRCVIPVLALCLLLSGCGGKGRELETESMEGTQILLRVDGREVPLWRYLCWLTYACDQVREQYAAAGQEVDWDMELEDGTLAEYVKGRALADTVLYATVENWAERYGCTASGEEGAEGATLPLTGLSAAQQEELRTVGRMYAALYDLYCTEGSVLAPAAETLASFAEENGGMVLDRILITAGEEREAARQRASEVFSQLNSAEEPVAVFAALAAEGDDPVGPRPAENSGWPPALLEAARSLEVGQYSGILESDEGFSILMRMETDSTEQKEAHFDSLLQAAAEAAIVTVESYYHELKPQELFS